MLGKRERMKGKKKKINYLPFSLEERPVWVVIAHLLSGERAFFPKTFYSPSVLVPIEKLICTSPY
jgi:hypothetical protein